MNPRSIAIEAIFACYPKLTMACSITSFAMVTSATSMVLKRIAKGSLLFGSQTTQILKPKTVSAILRIRPLRSRSSGGFL